MRAFWIILAAIVVTIIIILIVANYLSKDKETASAKRAKCEKEYDDFIKTGFFSGTPTQENKDKFVNNCINK